MIAIATACRTGRPYRDGDGVRNNRDARQTTRIAADPAVPGILKRGAGLLEKRDLVRRRCRPMITLRCGKRPKRSITAWCRSAVIEHRRLIRRVATRRVNSAPPRPASPSFGMLERHVDEARMKGRQLRVEPRSDRALAAARAWRRRQRRAGRRERRCAGTGRGRRCAPARPRLVDQESSSPRSPLDRGAEAGGDLAVEGVALGPPGGALAAVFGASRCAEPEAEHRVRFGREGTVHRNDCGGRRAASARQALRHDLLRALAVGHPDDAVLPAQLELHAATGEPRERPALLGRDEPGFDVPARRIRLVCPPTAGGGVAEGVHTKPIGTNRWPSSDALSGWPTRSTGRSGGEARCQSSGSSGRPFPLRTGAPGEIVCRHVQREGEQAHHHPLVVLDGWRAIVSAWSA